MNIEYIQYKILITPLRHKVNLKQVMVHIYKVTLEVSSACWTEYSNET